MRKDCSLRSVIGKASASQSVNAMAVIPVGGVFYVHWLLRGANRAFSLMWATFMLISSNKRKCLHYCAFHNGVNCEVQKPTGDCVFC